MPTRRGSLPVAILFWRLAAFAAESALAMWTRLTDQQLLDGSDVIVTGTLIGQSRVKVGAADLTLGVVSVEQTFKGSVAGVVLIMLPGPDRPVSSSDIRFKVGQSGLWFLRLRGADERGIYVADHPQRFVAREHAQPQIDWLRKSASAR
jgi:hypothetical protein